MQTWLSNPGPNRMTRGLEFATQPYDLPRAEVLRNGPLFDSPVFRILPAKSPDHLELPDVLHAGARGIPEGR